jgi:hypothetical protein
MANSFSHLVQPLLDQYLVEYLAGRNGFLDKIYITNVQNDQVSEGGNSAIITMPSSDLVATDVNTNIAPVPQNITLPKCEVTFDQWKEVPINLSVLENRIVRGGLDTVLKRTAKNMGNALLRGLDTLIAQQYVNAGNATVGAYNSDITAPIMNQAWTSLLEADVDMLSSEDVYFVTSAKGYGTDLMGIDKYTIAMDRGEVDNPSPIITAQIPKLLNLGIDISRNIQGATISGQAVQYSLMFERFAIAMGIQDFRPINEVMEHSGVSESFIQDPKTGIKIRSWMYLDPKTRQFTLVYDLKYGVNTLDANRMVPVLHKA